jgi:SAM-dependent methyltransferase
MDECYLQHYATLYRGHFWWQAREACLLKVINRYAPPNGFGHILDVGCGQGQLLNKLRPYGIPEGIEPAAVEDRTPRSNTPCCPKIYRQPFDKQFEPSTRYGLVLMLDVLEHLPDAGAALVHVGRLMTGKGMLIVTVPALMGLWTSQDTINHHVTRFSKQSLAPLLTQAKFQTCEMRYFYQWLVPLKLGIRAFERIFPLESPPKPPKIPWWPVNKTAYFWTRLEWETYGRYCQWAGSSLLAVARLSV